LSWPQEAQDLEIRKLAVKMLNEYHVEEDFSRTTRRD